MQSDWDKINNPISDVTRMCGRQNEKKSFLYIDFSQAMYVTNGTNGIYIS